MDGKRFDRVVRSLSAARNRRGLLQVLVALAGLLPLLDADEAQAGKGAGGRKGGKRHGHNRPRRRHARRHKHKHKKNKNKKKEQPQEQCSPQTPDGPCAANQLCVEEECQPCTVTCEGDATACGAALQAAIDAAAAAGRDEVLVCPGRYGGNFTITSGVALVGAGDGDDPARDTILDAEGEGRVLFISSNGSGDVTLARLRLTGGAGPIGAGGGIYNRSTRTLTVTSCTVSGNAVASPGDGGGIANDGTLTLSDCQIENNTAFAGGGIYSGVESSTALTGNTQVRGNSADLGGGGIYLDFRADVTIDAGCQVTENEAPDGQGGGIYNDPIVGGSVTLESDQIVTDNSGGNCAGTDIDNCDG